MRTRRVDSVARRKNLLQLLFFKVDTIGVPLMFCLVDLVVVLLFEGVRHVAQFVHQAVDLLLDVLPLMEQL